MSRLAIAASGVGKRYRIGQSVATYQTFRDLLAHVRQPPSHRSEGGCVWALRDVNVEVPTGQVLGIVGRNGAGKSTLLKLLSAITPPTTGRIELRGRVASLLEVGTGFHGELTGRENVFLNGAILGMSRKEIRDKLDAIVAFSEVEAFIDTPVKRYSSGMYVRLAFAVAAHLEPEILIVDEVLAVGDLAFQRKCLGRMNAAAEAGRTVLFVSHNMGMIQSLCERALLLEKGRIRADGVPAKVIQEYVELTLGGAAADASVAFEEDHRLPFQLLSAALRSGDPNPKMHFDIFEPVQVEVTYLIRKSIAGTNVGLAVYHRGDPLFLTWDTDADPARLEPRAPGRYTARVVLPAPLLKAGQYQLRFEMGVIRTRSVHKPDEGLTLTVIEQSVGTNLLSYSADRAGRLVVPLAWTLTASSAPSVPPA
jgi:lipopolysaccharide transport system ATP-binding protein